MQWSQRVCFHFLLLLVSLLFQLESRYRRQTFLCIAWIALVSYSAMRRFIVCDRHASAPCCRNNFCDGLTERNLREDLLRLLRRAGLGEGSRLGFSGEDVKGTYAMLELVLELIAAGIIVAQGRREMKKATGRILCQEPSYFPNATREPLTSYLKLRARSGGIRYPTGRCIGGT